MKARVFSFIFMCAVLAILFAAALVATGCAKTQAVAEEVGAIHDATRQAIAEIKAEIATYPKDDPVRVALEERLAKLEKKLDGVVTTDAVVDAVPYGGLALLVARLAYVEIDRRKKRKATGGKTAAT